MRWRVLGFLVGAVPVMFGAEPGFHAIRLNAPKGDAPGFTLLSGAETGFAITNRLAQARFVTNQIHLNGSGVALGDVDGDGRCDVFLSGLDGANALFRNLGGWRFTNIAEQAGVALEAWDATGAALADVDGDADLDLVLNTIGAGTHILLNDGKARYHAAAGSPYNLGRGGMSLALADTDADGDLDLYVGNYRTETFRDQPGTRFRGRNVGGNMVLQTVNGRPVTEPDLVGRYTIHPSGAVEEHGEADLFLRNEGGGRFTPLELTSGMFVDEQGQPLKEPPYDWTLSVMFRDVNGDRAPDLYLCNDFSSPDELWFNDGTGRFRRAPRLALRHTPMFSMGVDFADLDHDEQDDFVVVDMLGPTHAKRQTQLGDVRPQLFPAGQIENRPQYSYNQLFLNRGDETFAEVGWFAGLTATDWTWNPMFLDVDLDGHEDLLLATGHELEMMDADIGEKAERARQTQRGRTAEIQRLKLLYPRHDIPNVALRNRGDMTFEDATEAWRFGVSAVSTGMAAGDLDNDGDLDVVINNLNGAASLLRNDAAAPRLAVRLRGRPPNTRGIGARIRVTGEGTTQTQVIIAGGRYLSSDEPMRVFATGGARELMIEVVWRGGEVSVVRQAEPNRLYEIAEPNSSLPLPAGKSRGSPLFSDESAALSHSHIDEPFDDFAAQPLLPQRYSHLGPGVACADLDGDGWTDLAVSGGRGGRVDFFRNLDGRLTPWPGTARNVREVNDRDILGLLAWPESTNQTFLLGTAANWEDGTTHGAAVRWLHPSGGLENRRLPAESSSPGPIAAADFDGDGDLDLFVGGRALPSRYPEPARSRLWRNVQGHLIPATDLDKVLEDVGMVAGALWSDVWADGFPELILACDWGPIRIFRNEGGSLREDRIVLRAEPGGALGLPTTSPRQLSELTGCWSGLAAADLDGDGRLDLIVGNWGLNSRWQLRGEHPLRLYYGDYDGNGSVEVLEAVWVREVNDYAPLRALRPVSAAIPFVREVAPSYQAFSQATLPKLLGSRMAQTRHVEAVTLASVALLNRDDAFELRTLPRSAQLAPVYAVVTADFDGDGSSDVFVGQNCFAVHGDAARQDAGRGLLLRGDGAGGLSPLSGEESGMHIYGEQRGAAAADFDADGRVDLVVAQNAGPTRLFQNRGGKPGLRVRVVGPPLNPMGVGARLRLQKGSALGPSCEIHAGSGWLSQDSPVLVMTGLTAADAIQVHWPGGGTSTQAIPPGAREVVVRR